MKALGKSSDYALEYDKNILDAIPRGQENYGRECGFDYWRCYEVSWLNARGKPIVRVLEIVIPATSSNIVESKSLKLYLNSLNNRHFSTEMEILNIIKNDISECIGTKIQGQFLAPQEVHVKQIEGMCLDELDIGYDDIEWLEGVGSAVHASVYTHLFRCNCPITGQPDWASIQIRYYGPQISNKGLLQYLISFRNHKEFHEGSIEKIYRDIKAWCNPIKLTVFGMFLRRGGIDITPVRSTDPIPLSDVYRTNRQ